MSPVTKVFRRLSSRINEAPCEHTGPFDSNASGTKMWLCEMSSYLASFLVDAASVTLPALCEDSPMYDDVMVFSTVTSQTMLFPVLQGIRERLRWCLRKLVCYAPTISKRYIHSSELSFHAQVCKP